MAGKGEKMDPQAVRDISGKTSGEREFLRQVDKVAGVGGQGADADMPMGQRIRMFRQQKGLTLGDLAQRTGLSEDMLDAIEADAGSPPLGVLVKLGRALDTKLGTLITSGEDKPWTVTRADQRTRMTRYATQRDSQYGYSYEHLAPDKAGRHMEPFVVTLHPAEGQVEPSTHHGQEFIFVLQGQVEAIVADGREILGPGDSIYYDSSFPHLVRPHGSEAAQILAVIYSEK